MARDPKVTVIVDADTSGVQGGLTKSQAAITGFSAAAGTVLANFAERAIRGGVDLVNSMVDQASALQQSAGAVSAVFGQYADDVEAAASRAAEAVGLSTSAYENLAAVLGSQLKGAGTPMDEVAGKTDQLITLGADLAATYGGSVADAVSAISSLLRGERDPIERYAASITAASVAAYEAANGLDTSSAAAKAASDQQATLALLFEKTADAQGSFAAENDTLAGSQERLNAKWEDTQAALGEALLPALTLVVGLLSDFADWAKENTDVLGILIGVLGGTTAAVWLLNIAMTANPIGLIIVAIGILIAIIVLLIANWDKVVAAFGLGAQQIADFFAPMTTFISDQWNSAIDSITSGWDQMVSDITAGIDEIIGWIQDAIGWFNDLFNASSNATAPGGGTFAAVSAPATAMVARFAAASPAPDETTSAAARSAAAATVRASTRRDDGAAGDTNITVNGALDPVAVARQVARLLRARDARVGLAAAAGVRA